MERRTVLRQAAAALLVVPPAAGAPRADLTDPCLLYGAYSRMRGMTRARPGLWWYRGTMFGARRGDILRPLTRIEGCSFNLLRVRDDGGLAESMAEAGYFEDIETGAVLESWTNPLNGARCKPEHYKSAQHLVVEPGGFRVEESGAAPADANGRIGPAVTSGDVVWITENFSAKYVFTHGDAPPRSFLATSMASFAARLSDLADPRRAFVPCTLAYQTLTGMLSWMHMEPDAGENTWQLMGRKLESIAELPPALHDRLAGDYPGWLQSPGV